MAIPKLKDLVKEFISTATGVGGARKQKGYKSPDQKTKKTAAAAKKSTWDTKKTNKTTKTSDYNTKNTDLLAFSARKYRKAGLRRGTYVYSPTLQKGYSLNPDWTTKSNARTAALSARDTADSEEASAETDYNRAQADYESRRDQDLKDTYGQKPPVGGARGTARGKGKGGKKKTN